MKQKVASDEALDIGDFAPFSLFEFLLTEEQKEDSRKITKQVFNQTSQMAMASALPPLKKTRIASSKEANPCCKGNSAMVPVDPVAALLP